MLFIIRNQALLSEYTKCLGLPYSYKNVRISVLQIQEPNWYKKIAYKSVFFEFEVCAVFLESGLDLRRTWAFLFAKGRPELVENADANWNMKIRSLSIDDFI